MLVANETSEPTVPDISSDFALKLSNVVTNVFPVNIFIFVAVEPIPFPAIFITSPSLTEIFVPPSCTADFRNTRLMFPIVAVTTASGSGSTGLSDDFHSPVRYLLS